MVRETLDQITDCLTDLQDPHFLVEAKNVEPKVVYVNPRGSLYFPVSTEGITGKPLKDVLGIEPDELGAILICLSKAVLLHNEGKYKESDAVSPELKIRVGTQARTLKTCTRIISTKDNGDLYDISISDATLERRLKARLTAIEGINRLQGFDEIKNQTGKIIETVIPFNSALIHLIDDDGNIIEFARWGEKPTTATPFTHKDESEIISEMVRSKKGIKIDNTHIDKRWKRTGREYIRSYMGAPIIIRDRDSKEKMIGILELNNDNPFAYEDEDLVSLISLAEYIANAFEKNDSIMRDPLCNDIYIYKGVKYYGEREFIRSLRFRPPHPISTMFIDLDHFGQVNSTFGHLKTNEILLEVINRLRKNTRDYDIIGRFGDEFMIVLPESGTETAKQAAVRIARSLKEDPIPINGQQITVTASIGIAQFTERKLDVSGDFQALIDHANHAMYISKDDGRDKITIWDQSIENRWQSRKPDSSIKIT